MSLLPVTLACAGVNAGTPAQPACDSPGSGGARSPPVSEPEFERILILAGISSCICGIAGQAARLPGVKETILLGILDRTGYRGAAVLSGERSVSPRANALMRLAAEKNRIESAGQAARIIIAAADEDEISGTVIGTAAKENAALVVLQKEPGFWFTELFRENPALQTLFECRTKDVLLFPAPKTGGRTADASLFSRVLVPVKFSPFDRETLAWVVQQGKADELVLLHVVPAQDGTGHDAEIQKKERMLAALARAAGRNDSRITILVREGDPAREIARAAADTGASLVLMPRSGLARHMSGETGDTVTRVAKHLACPLLVRRPRALPEIRVAELPAADFDLAEALWVHYRHQTADRANDRIFGLWLGDDLVSVAWCKRHPDGLEVDGVFTLEAFRRRGYARHTVGALVSACGREPLFMHATLELVEFYRTLGFVPIPESGLPQTIRERFAFALGNLKGANACPMQRTPAPAVCAGHNNPLYPGKQT